MLRGANVIQIFVEILVVLIILVIILKFVTMLKSKEGKEHTYFSLHQMLQDGEFISKMLLKC